MGRKESDLIAGILAIFLSTSQSEISTQKVDPCILWIGIRSGHASWPRGSQMAVF
jgi:hypothetical protein